MTATAPFCVGFALKQGDIPSGSGIAVTGATAQVTVKNTWPDGSAKFALVAGTASLTAGVAATVALAAGTSSTGTALTLADLQAAMTQPVTVTCGSFGSASWSGADWAFPFETWVVGHRMSSWVYRKPVGSDAHLVAWLEVRLFSTGEVEMLPWVENGFLAVAGPANRSGSFTFLLNGSTRFNAAFDLPNHSRTPLVNGATVSHWIGTPYDLLVKHDGEYLQTTGLVPAYFARTPATAASVLGLPTSFSPLQRGSYPVGMGAGGYSNSIGLLPEWDAVHLTSPATATYKGVLFQAFSAGRYGIHYRDETATPAHRPALIKNYPALTIKEPSNSTHAGWTVPPQTSGTQAPGWATSHHPSVGYLAYLLTGWTFHRDTVQFASSYNSLFEAYPVRNGSEGVWKSTSAGATRHVAWCLRTLAQAIAVTPDSDIHYRSALIAQYQNNVNYYHARYIAQPHNPFGFVTPYSDYSNIAGSIAAGATSTVIPCNPGQLGGAGFDITRDDQYVGHKLYIGSESRTITRYVTATETITVSPGFSVAPAAGTGFSIKDEVCFDAPWMSDFFIAALGYSKDLAIGFDANTSTKFESFYAWKAKSVIGRMGSSAATEFLYRDYAPYALAVAPFDSPNGIPSNSGGWNTGSGPWFADWGAIYAATFGGRTPPGSSYPAYASPGPRVDGDLRPFMSPEFPAAEALPAIAYAVKHGLPGADAAYARLSSAANWNEFVLRVDAQPVWGVASGVFRR
ncbi:MAG: hypothetical protein Q7U99_01955 [Rubrivivax sp.]|nr:hypothetical protein [Rubrivivax sp.]